MSTAQSGCDWTNARLRELKLDTSANGKDLTGTHASYRTTCTIADTAYPAPTESMRGRPVLTTFATSKLQAMPFALVANQRTAWALT